MRITAIIQARMGSTRLPKKVLMPLEGKPVLRHIVDRLGSVQQINNVVIATSESEINDEIVDFCKTENIDFYRGSEDDVLNRFYKTTQQYPSDIFLRVTGDCPLIDPTLVESLINYFF